MVSIYLYNISQVIERYTNSYCNSLTANLHHTFVVVVNCTAVSDDYDALNSSYTLDG